MSIFSRCLNVLNFFTFVFLRDPFFKKSKNWQGNLSISPLQTSSKSLNFSRMFSFISTSSSKLVKKLTISWIITRFCVYLKMSSFYKIWGKNYNFLRISFKYSIKCLNHKQNSVKPNESKSDANELGSN